MHILYCIYLSHSIRLSVHCTNDQYYSVYLSECKCECECVRVVQLPTDNTCFLEERGYGSKSNRCGICERHGEVSCMRNGLVGWLVACVCVCVEQLQSTHCVCACLCVCVCVCVLSRELLDTRGLISHLPMCCILSYIILKSD